MVAAISLTGAGLSSTLLLDRRSRHGSRARSSKKNLRRFDDLSLTASCLDLSNKGFNCVGACIGWSQIVNFAYSSSSSRITGATLRPTYFASFLLGEDPEKDPPSFGEVLEVIADWIFENPHRELERPEGWPDPATPSLEFANGERVLVQRLESDGQVVAAGVRFEHSDQNSRIWRTDCICHLNSDSRPMLRFSVSVAAGSLGEGLYPVAAPSTRPRIVRSIMEHFGARETFPLKPTFLRIQTGETADFVGFLLNQSRTIPVVFVSRRNFDGALPCDAAVLADKLVGVAYVCVADEPQLSWELANYMDNRLNTYDGAIRIYWPKMNATDSPYRHRLWTLQRQFAMEGAGRSLANELLTTIVSASVTRRIPGLVRWEDVEREIARQAVQQYQSAGTGFKSIPAEWLRQYEDDLAALDATRKDLEVANEKLREKEEEVRHWKQTYLQSLRIRTVGADVADDDDMLLEDATGAIDLATKRFKNRLLLIDGRVGKEAQQFEEPELLFAALSWLATVYWSAKSGAERCADLDKSCREACQFRYNAHQSEVTMGMFSSDYEVMWEGRKVKLKEHIGFGTSTEPRHTIRIAFFFDPVKQKVVIGYIGQHQATRKSN